MTLNQLNRVKEIFRKNITYNITELLYLGSVECTYETEYIKIWTESGIAGVIDINSLITDESLLHGFILSSVDVLFIKGSITFIFKSGQVKIRY
jgi:hypothetical protein